MHICLSPARNLVPSEVYVALTNLKPDTVEQLKVHVESKAPLRITHCCSICDQNGHI